MGRACKLILLWVVSMSFTTVTLADPEIKISEAWIPEGPPVSTNMAGYFKLENGTDKTITLTGVSSPAFSMAEIHKTDIVDGLAKMVHQEKIDVSPGETLMFEPGSYHLMLMAPVEPLVEGDTVSLQIQSGQGQKVNFIAKVMRPKL